MQLLHMYHEIIEYTSRSQDIKYKLQDIGHTSQDIEYTSQDYRI